MPVSAADESATMLYNGVELPKLPLSLSDYEGLIYYREQFSIYEAYLGSSITPEDVKGTVRVEDYFRYALENGAWVQKASGSVINTSPLNNSNGRDGNLAIWSSFDWVYNGTTIMLASDPVDPNAPSFSANLILRSVHALDDSVSILGAITDISDTSVPVSYTWSLYIGGSLVRTGAYDGTPSTGSTAVDLFSTIGDLTPETEYEITYELTADGEPTGITASTSFTTLAGTGSGGGDVSDPDYTGQLDSIEQGIGDVQESVDNVGSKVDGIQDTLTETKEEITSLPGKIASAILDGIKSLFVPSAEDLTEIMNAYDRMLSVKLGFAWQVVDLLRTFVVDLETSLESGEAYEFNFPGVKLPMQGEEFVLVPETPVSLDNDLMDVLRPVLGTVVSIIAVIAFVNMCHDYVLAIVSGVSVYQFERRKE